MAGMEDLAGLRIKHASVSGNTDGMTLVAAVTGKRIKVLQYCLVVSGTGAIQFKSATTALSGAMPGVANSQFTGGGYCPDGHVITAASEALNLGNSSTLTVTGYLVYVEA